jgi:predicted DNA-binding transcriptional regulator YafY
VTATSGRLLELLSLLQTRRDWPGDELARRLEVSGRTVRRDVERLRTLGYPVEATTGPDGGYRLEAGTAMPPLVLDDEEAVAIAVGLRTAAGASVAGIEETSVRALVKLEQVLPPHLRRRVSALDAATATLDRPVAGPRVEPEALTAIAGACRDTVRLRFGYRSREGEDTRRHVEPLSLVHLGPRWYLVAWDCAREDWRTFRLDRIAGVPAPGERFTPRALPGGDPAAYVAESRSTAVYRYQARVTLQAPADEVSARHRWTEGRLEAVDERSCVYTASDDSLEWLALRIGFLGIPFEVHEPPELREWCAALAQRFEVAAAGA